MSFFLGMLVAIALLGGIGIVLLLMSSGAAGVGTSPARISVKVTNDRHQSSTVELVFGPAGLRSTKTAENPSSQTLYRVLPYETVTFLGETSGFYDSAWFRFAASDQYDTGTIITARDQPTGTVEFRGGSWGVRLVDDESGKFRAVIQSAD